MSSRRPDVDDPIAVREMILVRADGTTTPLTVLLGRPYVVDAGHSRCPVQVKGLDPRYPDISGNDVFQAMRLALSLVVSRLTHQLAKGLTLRDPTSTESYDAQGIVELFSMEGPRAHGFASRLRCRQGRANAPSISRLRARPAGGTG